MPKAKKARVWCQRWNRLPKRSRCRDKYERAFQKSLVKATRGTESEADSSAVEDRHTQSPTSR